MADLFKPLSKKPAAIIDLDGTLVNVQSIRHYVQNGNKDFDSFHRASIDCPPNMEVVELVKSLRKQGMATIVVTARSDKYRKLTDFWLATNEVECDEVIMRGGLDSRCDLDVKASMFVALSSKYDIQVAVDDREDLLENWIILGIASVFKVGETDGALQRLR